MLLKNLNFIITEEIAALIVLLELICLDRLWQGP